MIALVAGEVVVRRGDHVVLATAAGVGYRLAVSAETLRAVPSVGGSVSLFTHLVVREDALSLYGFAGEAERDLFLLLIAVQGVGPKMAQAVLSGGPARDIAVAVAAGDIRRLTAVPGIGKRTAERIIVELRTKAGELEIDQGAVKDRPDDGEVPVAGGADDPRRLAREALLELGFATLEAERLLADASGQTPEQLLQQALKAARQ